MRIGDFPRTGHFLKLYHRSTQTRKPSSTMDSKDGTGTYLTERLHSGVWLSDVPLDCNEGAKGDVLLEVMLDLPETELVEYEWVEEGKSYREWLIPAAIVNAKGKVQVVGDEDSLPSRFPLPES